MNSISIKWFWNCIKAVCQHFKWISIPPPHYFSPSITPFILQYNNLNSKLDHKKLFLLWRFAWSQMTFRIQKHVRDLARMLKSFTLHSTSTAYSRRCESERLCENLSEIGNVSIQIFEICFHRLNNPQIFTFDCLDRVRRESNFNFIHSAVVSNAREPRERNAEKNENRNV